MSQYFFNFSVLAMCTDLNQKFNRLLECHGEPTAGMRCQIKQSVCWKCFFLVSIGLHISWPLLQQTVA